MQLQGPYKAEEEGRTIKERCDDGSRGLRDAAGGLEGGRGTLSQGMQKLEKTRTGILP